MAYLNVLCHHIFSIACTITPCFQQMRKASVSNSFVINSLAAESVYHDKLLLITCKLGRKYVMSNCHVQLETITTPSHYCLPTQVVSLS